ncbi:hypothetical protein TCAL_09093 [Tigriopus californicus]|uniref:RanBP2-type domain-containing protein n=1 Tax=Tigriopus californicus TaxID=6832 RepID=A0A553N9C5_TIGCA|nr:protein tamozhennic-like [Tigriopus californicus]TRY62030.1 hypothetical protein TCAL_09093 [Tigriopus californicus]|eukprot:TCALIF_09093-PA protein Name:"Similar to tamo Protein tamozhennic (Drosophila melanogaster)" AED:0.02 eAED:0.02 QI:492/1/1/1/0.8/0.66/6/256/577
MAAAFSGQNSLAMVGVSHHHAPYRPYAPPGPTPASMSPSMALTAELWLKIDQLHLNYLRAEENTKKFDIRKKLEGYIHQYLCLVPHERKFCNPLTAQVIYESARWVPDFSALKAAQAFEALETYAANLINQPWRPEFKEVKQYGGFYQHNIESALSGAERLFTLMGYRATGQKSLSLEGPVEQDAVTKVARDCILAYMECQIIVSIVQGVSAQFPCSCEEAMNFRREHISTPEQAIRSIAYLKNQQCYQNNRSNGASTAPLRTPNGSEFNPFQSSLPHTTSSAGTMYSAHSQNGHSTVIPTGRLVDVEHKSDVNHRRGSSPSGRSDASYPQNGPIPITVQHLEEENRRKSLGNGLPENGIGGNYESWDYVYRQLENIGYTKDQAERPDVLALLNKVSMARQKSERAGSRHDVLSPLSMEEKELLKQIQRTHISSTGPVQPEDPGFDEADAVHRRFRRSSGDRDRHRDSHKRRSTQGDLRKSQRHSRPLSPPEVDTTSKPKNGWQCHACTFNNGCKVDICEMCGKSRNSPELLKSSTTATDSSDQEDTISCQKCTLLNDRKLKTCDACGASLHKKRID